MTVDVAASPDRTDAFLAAYEAAVLEEFAKQENEAVMRDTRLIEGAGTDWIPVAGFDPGAVPVADGTGPRVDRVVGASSTPCPRCGTSSQCVARIERTEERTDPFQPFKSMARDRGPTLYFVECGFCGYGERGIATAISTDRQPGSAFEVFRIAAEVKMVRGLASDELVPGDAARGLAGLAGDLAAAQRRLEEIEALPPNTPIPTSRGVVTQADLRAQLIALLEAPTQVSGSLRRDEMGNLILPAGRGTLKAPTSVGQIVTRKYGREQGCPSCGARPDRVNTTGREDRQRSRYALVCGVCSYAEKGEVVVWNRNDMQVNITAVGNEDLCPTCNARLSREVRFAASYLTCSLCKFEMPESEFRRVKEASGGTFEPVRSAEIERRQREAASRAEAERPRPQPAAAAPEVRPVDIRGDRAFSWDDQ